MRATPGQIVGLPLAATAVMFGVVFAANGGLYGWLGTVGGIVLTASGLWAGRRIHLSAGERISGDESAPDQHQGDTST